MPTGVLREDGLADSADGLGGGSDRAAWLAIMRDNAVGAYGVLTLAAVLAGRPGGAPADGAVAGAAAGDSRPRPGGCATSRFRAAKCGQRPRTRVRPRDPA